MAGTPALAGLVDGEQVTLICGTPTFDQTGVGENIHVRFTEFALFGEPETLANYALRQPTGLTASILAHAAGGSEYSVNSHDWLNVDFLVTAKKQADALTDREKELLGKAALDKLNALLRRLEELKKPTTPATGDSFDPMFWTGMMLLALGAAAYVTLASKKSKKH